LDGDGEEESLLHVDLGVPRSQERPYQHDSTASRLLSEVKHVRARLVLRWGTTLESRVLFFSYFWSRTVEGRTRPQRKRKRTGRTNRTNAFQQKPKPAQLLPGNGHTTRAKEKRYLHILLVAMDLSLLHSRDPCLSIHATSKDDPTSNHRLGSRGHFLAILREINRHSLLAVQRSAAQRSAATKARATFLPK
jgi:hypothetical protein